MSSEGSTRRGSQWQGLLESAGEASAEEARILELLGRGMTQAEVGRELGLSRSAVWRRVKRVRGRVRQSATETESGPT